MHQWKAQQRFHVLALGSLNKARGGTNVDREHRGDWFLFPFLEQATCTVICFGLTWHCWLYLSLSSAKLGTASLFSLAWRAEQQLAVWRGKVLSTLAAGLNDELRLLSSVKAPCSFSAATHSLQRSVIFIRHTKLGQPGGLYTSFYTLGKHKSNWTLGLSLIYCVCFFRFYFKSTQTRSTNILTINTEDVYVCVEATAL